MAQFIVAVDFSIVNVALPSIQANLGLSAEALQWVITAFALTFGGLLMLGGRAADRVWPAAHVHRRVVVVRGVQAASPATPPYPSNGK